MINKEQIKWFIQSVLILKYNLGIIIKHLGFFIQMKYSIL